MKAAPPLLVAALLFLCRLAGAQDLPTPPEQTHPWTAPPTSLPEAVVSAAAALFDAGLADPRGCEYREVELILGWGPAREHGWILPPAAANASRAAIGWNGVVYPVKSVGAPVDLAKDLAALAGQKFRDHGRGWPMSEGGSLDAKTALPLKVALLLRLGEAPLAETLWRDGCAGEAQPASEDPYAGMAAVWLGCWYERAVHAYLHGDDAAALAVCQSLLPAEAKARATALARGHPDPWPARRYSETLWQLPVLTAEAQRRIDEPPRVPVLDSGQPAAGPERIAALIRDLELVRVHQYMNPGETDVLDDPVVQALVKVGDAAVPALLACLVDDQRLTRSRYTQRLSAGGPIIPVYEAAYRALFRLLNVKFLLFEHDSGKADWQDEREPRDLSAGDRRTLAAKLEVAWKKSRKEDPLEHAYNTLRDDHAGRKAWLQAVDDIVQPADGPSTDYRLLFPAVGGYSLRTDGKPFTPRGEALRARTDPSVRELLARRFEQFITEPGPQFLSSESLAEHAADIPGKLLLALAGWDGNAHPDELRRLQGELAAHFRGLTPHAEPDSGLEHDRQTEAHLVIRVCEKRLELGDARALADYAEFLPTLTTHGGTTGNFQLLWRHPDDPDIARAAEKIFAPGSPWLPLVTGHRHGIFSLIRTPLVGVPAFQQALDRGLEDKSAAGQVTLEENGTLDDGTSRLYTLDPLAPPKGSKVDYRLCDNYAHELSGLDGCPECELYWPPAERDRAVAACRAFLQRYAGNFRYREPEDKGRDNPDGYVSGPPIHFPVLDHPATADDVEAGRAVFTLPAPARVCRLPGLPLPVERPGRPVEPQDASDGEGHQVVSYQTSGKVWQVEETLVNGQWERYYGFVGRHQMEKVPAAEITFGSARGTALVTPEISGSIETPRRFVGGDEGIFAAYLSDFIPRGAPVPVKVTVCNHSALDQTLPGAVVLPPGAGKALPPGIRLSLAYSEKVPARRRDYADPPFDYGAWRDVPSREEIRVMAGEGSGPVLSPGQTLTILGIDLRDYFDTSRAGSYRLRASFHVPGQPDRRTDEIIFSVAG